MTRNKAARNSGNYSRACVPCTADAQSITRDVLLAVSGVVLIVGIPFVMAVLKQWGWW